MRLFLLWLLVRPALGVEWTTHALRLTGESDKVHDEAVAALRMWPNLEGTLKTALIGDKKYLALDVIAALSLQSMMADLFAQSENDENGSIYLTINALLNSDNQTQIAQLYLDRLRHHKGMSMPSQVVLLDTLGRMGISLSDKDLTPYLESSSFEVRSAALYYLRYQVLKFGMSARLPLIKNFLIQEPYQIRLQALYLILDLPSKLKTQAQPLLANCKADRHREVQGLCRSLAGEAK